MIKMKMMMMIKSLIKIELILAISTFTVKGMIGSPQHRHSVCMPGTFSAPFVFISKRYHCHRLYYHLIIIIQIEFKGINPVSQDMSHTLGILELRVTTEKL